MVIWFVLLCVAAGWGLGLIPLLHGLCLSVRVGWSVWWWVVYFSAASLASVSPTFLPADWTVGRGNLATFVYLPAFLWVTPVAAETQKQMRWRKLWTIRVTNVYQSLTNDQAFPRSYTLRWNHFLKCFCCSSQNELKPFSDAAVQHPDLFNFVLVVFRIFG